VQLQPVRGVRRGDAAQRRRRGRWAGRSAAQLLPPGPQGGAGVNVIKLFSAFFTNGTNKLECFVPEGRSGLV
jgi:hypothetical protein